jgi:hypothetical protein
VPWLHGRRKHTHYGMNCTFLTILAKSRQMSKPQNRNELVKNNAVLESSYVILMNDGFDELKILRSNTGAKLTRVSTMFVMSSSSSAQ